MNNAPTYTNRSNIIAASILGASLVASALIVTQKPAASTDQAITTSAKPTFAPPFTQKSVEEQFRKQLIADPTIQPFQRNGEKYTLADVKFERVTYSAKTDDFGISYQLI